MFEKNIQTFLELFNSIPNLNIEDAYIRQNFSEYFQDWHKLSLEKQKENFNNAVDKIFKEKLLVNNDLCYNIHYALEYSILSLLNKQFLKTNKTTAIFSFKLENPITNIKFTDFQDVIQNFYISIIYELFRQELLNNSRTCDIINASNNKTLLSQILNEMSVYKEILSVRINGIYDLTKQKYSENIGALIKFSPYEPNNAEVIVGVKYDFGNFQIHFESKEEVSITLNRILDGYKTMHLKGISVKFLNLAEKLIKNLSNSVMEVEKMTSTQSPDLTRPKLEKTDKPELKNKNKKIILQYSKKDDNFTLSAQALPLLKGQLKILKYILNHPKEIKERTNQLSNNIKVNICNINKIAKKITGQNLIEKKTYRILAKIRNFD